MTVLVIYSTILTAVLLFIFWNKFFGKGKIYSQEINKLVAENDVLKIQHNQDLRKLQETFSGEVKTIKTDDFISGNSERRTSDRVSKRNKKSDK